MAQSADTLVGVSRVKDTLVCTLLRDAHSVVRLHTLQGDLVEELALPGLGSTGGFDGHDDDPLTYFAFTSFTAPTTHHRLDVDTRGADAGVAHPVGRGPRGI